MEHVIIGLSDRSKGAVIKEIVVTNGFLDVEICTSGEEVLRLANAYAGGIVICGYKVGSMLYSQVQEMLPPQFGFLLLLSRNQAALVDTEELFSLVLPIQKIDFIRTVKTILRLQQEKDGPSSNPVLVRPQEERVLIEKAKLFLMNHHHISEEAAHRYIQRNSMNRGWKPVEMARWILQEKDQGEERR